MFNISSFLDKFKALGVKELLLKEKIVHVVSQKTKIILETKDISVKNGIIQVKVSPAAKSELYMKKRVILDAVNNEAGSSLKDLR